MKNKFLKKLLLLTLLYLGFGYVSFAEVILYENFSGGPSNFFSGNHTYSSSNSWSLTQIKGATAENAYGGIGSAALFSSNILSSIISPLINSVGTITFKYRELNPIGGGTFTVSMSINGAAFNTIGTQSFSGTNYSVYSVVVNELSNNIKIKISTNSPTYLIVDEMEVTNYVTGPSLNASPSILTGFSYINGSGPSLSKSYILSATNLIGAPGDISITAPLNYEISLNNSIFSGNVNIPYTSSTIAATSVYVRLKAGLSVSAYNSELIVNAGGGANSINVICNGSVSAAPYLTLSASSLLGFSYSEGYGPSQSQTYNLSGGSLIGAPGNILITAPPNYEVSNNNITFFSSVSVAYTSAYLSSTPLFVRLKAGLPAASYNLEQIVHSVNGAQSVSLNCSGIVTPPPSPYLIADLSTLSGFNYIEGYGPSQTQFYNLSGGGLTGFPSNIIATAPANYELSLDNLAFASSVNVAYTGSSLQSTPIYVRLKAGLPINYYNSEIITNSGGGATTINVACNGNVTSPPPPNLIANPSVLSSFTYVMGSGPSLSQHYYLSGSNLTGSPGNITITTPLSFELSLDNMSFSDSLNIVYSSSTLSSTQIYVRLKAELSVNSYNSEVITNTGGGASTVNVLCSGNVTPPPPPLITVNPSVLNGFTYEIGSGPSFSQSYIISGNNLTGAPGNIVTTAPADYEVSADNVNFSTSINIPYLSATLSATPVYVRLIAGLTVASYNSEIIINSGGGSNDVNVTCNGSVSSPPLPLITVNPQTLSGFNYTVGSGPSTSQSYTISGSNLTGAPGNIVISSSSNFEISLDNLAFSYSLSIPFSSSVLSSTSVYVRLKAGLSVNSYNSELIINSGGGAAEANVNCSGIVNDIIVGACLSEGFSSGTTVPLDWTFTSIGGTYTSSGNYGLASPSLKFDATGDAIETPVVTNASELSFWIKGQGATGSSLLVSGFNGSTWITIENILLSTITTGTTKIYNSSSMPVLESGFSKFKFTYTKSTGNLAFDDVQIICDQPTNYDIFLANNNDLKDILIFPNPASNKLSINYAGNLSFIKSIRFTNILGRTVIERFDCFSEIINNEFRIDLNPGIYTILIETSNRIYSKKLIIN